MKKNLLFLTSTILITFFAVSPFIAQAQGYYYGTANYVPWAYSVNYTPNYFPYNQTYPNINYLDYSSSQYLYPWNPSYDSYIPYESLYTYTYTSSSYSNQKPKVTTSNVVEIQDDRAELRGSVDMNDYNNGIVFFVYGQDESNIDDISSDYDRYRDVKDDEDNNTFLTLRVDSDLDSDEYYSEEIDELESDQDYYVRICVEYERSNNDTLACGVVREFTTDN